MSLPCRHLRVPPQGLELEDYSAHPPLSFCPSPREGLFPGLQASSEAGTSTGRWGQESTLKSGERFVPTPRPHQHRAHHTDEETET